jgi:hypothetical protein
MSELDSATPDHAVLDPAEPDAVLADSVSIDSVPDEDEADEVRPTLLEQMGGVRGLIYSSVPTLVFVTANIIGGLKPALWAAMGVALAILVWQIVRKQGVQPAISGFFGVAIAAFIAYRFGSARDFFLYGIWLNIVYGGIFLLSVLARWPLAGVIWSTLNGTGFAWRSDKLARRYYDLATIVWTVVFGSRIVVQQYLYNQDQVTALGIARISMGWPLTAVAALVTVWAVRKADHRVRTLTPSETAAPAI